MSKEEKDFLNNYDITKYDRPSLATDIAVFTIMEDNQDNYRRLPEKKLKLLMIQRKDYPFKDMWALPGGFVEKYETVEDSAKRELLEETNVNSAYLKHVGVFSDKGRDPRGWIISNTFMAIINGNKCILEAGEDAGKAEWFIVIFRMKSENKKYQENLISVEIIYELILKSNDNEINAEVMERKEYKEFHETSELSVISSEGLAFDHAKIITYVMKKLREEADNEGRIVFDFMPEYFTLTDLQKVYEIILDKELLTANFRRKISDMVCETDKMDEGAGHRPAKLFKRNLEQFYR